MAVSWILPGMPRPASFPSSRRSGRLCPGSRPSPTASSFSAVRKRAGAQDLRDTLAAHGDGCVLGVLKAIRQQLGKADGNTIRVTVEIRED